VQSPAQLLPPTEGGLHHTMSLIKTCIVVLCNGNLVGMHPDEEAASNQAREIADRWKLEADCGCTERAPKIAVLSFNSWMQLSKELAF